jgi:hypothetical protein
MNGATNTEIIAVRQIIKKETDPMYVHDTTFTEVTLKVPPIGGDEFGYRYYLQAYTDDGRYFYEMCDPSGGEKNILFERNSVLNVQFEKISIVERGDVSIFPPELSDNYSTDWYKFVDGGIEARVGVNLEVWKLNGTTETLYVKKEMKAGETISLERGLYVVKLEQQNSVVAKKVFIR